MALSKIVIFCPHLTFRTALTVSPFSYLKESVTLGQQIFADFGSYRNLASQILDCRRDSESGFSDFCRYGKKPFNEA
jgi:hypothetical protein